VKGGGRTKKKKKHEQVWCWTKTEPTTALKQKTRLGPLRVQEGSKKKGANYTRIRGGQRRSKRPAGGAKGTRIPETCQQKSRKKKTNGRGSVGPWGCMAET